MKKIISLFIMLVFVASAFSLSAFAAEATTATTQNDTATEITNVGLNGVRLYRDWEKNGYPDDVGAVIFSADGYDPSSGVTTLYYRYIIYVLKGTSDERKAELSALMDSPYVTFRECTISKSTQDAYVASLRERLGELVYEVMPAENKYDLGLTVYYPEKNNGEIKNILESEFPQILPYCELRAGVNPIDLDATNEIWSGNLYDNNSIDTIGATAQRPILFIAIALVVVLTGAMFLVFRRKNALGTARTLALTNGDTETVSTTLTKKEVEMKISSSTDEPSDKVFDEIMKKL